MTDEAWMISVIMASYNASQYIQEAIASIVQQTYPHWELIIVDDGSTDSTKEIIEDYIQKDPRIRLIESDHGGSSRARNIAIQGAKYPWIAVMDSDDISLPQRLETQIKLAQEKPHVVAWGSAVSHMNSRGEVLSVSPLGPKTEEEFYWMRQEGHVVNLNHPTVLMKKEIFEKAGGYDPEFTRAMDLDLLDRMASYGPILSIPEPLLFYRVHLNSASMNRFFTQRLLMRYVRFRHLARLAGEKEPTYEEYLAHLEKRSVWKRWTKKLETLGMFYYRKAGLFVGEKQYLAGSFYLGLSGLLNPRYALPRIWNQALSPKTRKLLKRHQ